MNQKINKNSFFLKIKIKQNKNKEQQTMAD